MLSDANRRCPEFCTWLDFSTCLSCTITKQENLEPSTAHPSLGRLLTDELTRPIDHVTPRPGSTKANRLAFCVIASKKTELLGKP